MSFPKMLGSVYELIHSAGWLCRRELLHVNPFTAGGIMRDVFGDPLFLVTFISKNKIKIKYGHVTSMCKTYMSIWHGILFLPFRTLCADIDKQLTSSVDEVRVMIGDQLLR